MTVRVSFVGDSHLAPLAVAIRSMEPGRIQPTFFADILKRLRHLRVENGCLYPGNEGQRRRLLETSGGVDRIDPAQYDLFVIMGLEFEYPYECLRKEFYSRAVIEQTTHDLICGSLAMKVLTKLRQITDRPAWLLHKPLFAPEFVKPRLDALNYERFLELANETFGPLGGSVISQPHETRAGDCFSLSEYSRNPIGLNNQTGEAGQVNGGNHHKNEAFGRAIIRDLRSRIEVFEKDVGRGHQPWRPRRLGVILEKTHSEVILQLQGRDGARLDPAAAAIWTHCDGTRTRQEILATLCEQYSMSAEHIWPDLVQTLKSLVDIGAVEPGMKGKNKHETQPGAKGGVGDLLEIRGISELPTIRFCEDYPEPAIRGRFNKIVSDMDVSNVFNPSFFEQDGIRVFAFRAIPRGSSELTSYVSVDNGRKRAIHRISQDQYPDLHAPRLIDPKVFTVGEEIYLTFNTGWVKSGNAIFVMKVFPEMGNPKKVMFDARRRQERNWGFFSEYGEIYAVYQVSPLVILRLEGQTKNEWRMSEISRQSVVDVPGDLSIGTQPFKYEDRYYFMAHRKYRLENKKVYLGRLCSLDPGKMDIVSDATWMVHSPDSLFGAEPKHNTNLFSCTYFSGLQITDSIITLGYGINDVDFGFSSLALSEMFK